MLAFTYLPKRVGPGRLLLAVCLAATPLGCAATAPEESVELGQSSEAIVWASGGVQSAVQYFPAIGESLTTGIRTSSPSVPRSSR
jgi:hypothetical protein